MRYIDEFRDGDLARLLLRRLRAKTAGMATMRFMEVCGTHTVAIFRSGLRDALPPEISLLSGPGCPVCVTAQRDIDKAVELAGKPETILVTFGDMLKVPGTRSSLQVERAKGADVRVVYSPADALLIARQNPGKRVVFLGVGFETTTPAIALAIRAARQHGPDNFFVLALGKVMPPPLRALVDSGKGAIDGFLLPGHVSTIIGSLPYTFLAADYGMPSVISGFEPLDVLQSILMLVDQIGSSRAEVEIQYRRLVRPEGNPRAREVVADVFAPADAAWRGMGNIPQSGLELRAVYQQFNAEEAFDLDVSYSRDPAGCICGDMLRGIRQPYECNLFAKTCTPDNPVGPCMVSSEGTCAAFYQYGAREVRGQNGSRKR
ncbi:MAG: hydrogenase formation protein HypD [Chloroflexi bacterium]|nr:hydrogenase formation protein HypD [Chloroflexota bacterium]